MTSSGSPSDVYAETLAVFERTTRPGEPLTTPEVAESLDCERRATYERLKTLADRGDLETKKVGASARVWWRSDTGSTHGSDTGATSAAGSSEPDETNRGRSDATVERHPVDDVQRRTVDNVEQRAMRDARVLLDRVADAFVLLDTDWRFTYVNETAEAEFDMSADELLGNSLWELFPEISETPFHEHYHRAMEDGTPRTIEEYFEPWDRWYREHLYPSEHGLSIAFRDVTEHRERERELREAKSQLEDAIEAGAIGTWEWDVPGDTFVAGPAFARTFGVDPDEARNGVPLERFVSSIHDADRDRVTRSVDAAVADCGDYEEEYRVRNADDELQWVLARGHVECDDEGNPLTFAGVLTDITERKRTERELERHQAFLEESTDAVAVLDEDGTIEYVTPSIERILGYPPTEIVDTDGFDLIHPEDRDDLWSAFCDLLDEGKNATVRIEGRFRTADGEWRWLEIRGSNQLENSTIEGVVANARDITARKKQQEKRRLTIDRMTDAIVELDEDWRFTVVNEQAEELYGIAAEELLGRNVWDVFPDAVGTRFYEEFHRVMATDESTTFEEYYEGLDTWFQVHVYPSLDGGLSIYFRDVTEHKARERELEKRHAELAQLNRFNELVQELVREVLRPSTRTEIEQAVCDHLAASDFYRVAWIGERTAATATVTPRVWAEIDLDVGPSGTDERAIEDVTRELPERALENRDVCVERGIDDPFGDVGGDGAADVGSALAVPIGYEDVYYGVLVVYADSHSAFDDIQREIFADLGDTVGFAIAAADRKAALAADSVLDLTFDVRDDDQFFVQVATRLGTTVTLEGIAGLNDGAYLAYVAAGDASPEEVRDIASRNERIDRVRAVTDRLYEVRVTGQSIPATVAEYGGTVTDMTAEEEHGTVSVELPQTTDPGSAIDALESSVEDVELQTKRVVDRPIQTDGRFQSAVVDRLTDKQHGALRAAYLSGYFEHPRLSTGEAIAESLGISPSTFHQHLRVGLDKLLGELIQTTREDA